jgi:hypothetical protein
MVKAMYIRIPCHIPILMRTSILASITAIHVPINFINAIHAIGRISFLAAIHAIISALALIRDAMDVACTKNALVPGRYHIQFQCQCHILIEGCECGQFPELGWKV